MSNESQIKSHIEQLKKEHHQSRHWCYAYQIGTTAAKMQYRANDDGEPNNSAGMPIYGQIQSFDLTNVLIVVVRYFGGVKLGVSGLINAYRTAAQLALENAQLETRTINQEFLIQFEYKDMNKVMRLIKENRIRIIDQSLELSCEIKISVRLNETNQVYEQFDTLYGVGIKPVND